MTIKTIKKKWIPNASSIEKKILIPKESSIDNRLKTNQLNSNQINSTKLKSNKCCKSANYYSNTLYLLKLILPLSINLILS